MKKRISKALMVIMSSILMMSGIALPTNAEVSSHLQNTYVKIKAGETVNIAYLGGSVTNGWPDCIEENSWRQSTFDWIKEKFASLNTNFVQNHAAMGGTGTDLNCYNIDNSLKLGTNEQPDLLFLEFAINDKLEGLTYEQAGQYYETIIRKCYSANPYMDIVCVLTTNQDELHRHYDTAKAHYDIAKLYDLPVVWLGELICADIIKNHGSINDGWSNYFEDNVHPSKKGHQKYFDYIRDNILKPEFDKVNNSDKAKKSLPSPKYNDDYMLTRSISVKDYPIEGILFNEGTAIAAGASFKAKFTGTAIGIMYTGNNQNGSIRYSVDGGEKQTLDLYKDTSYSTEYVMLAEGLENGEHTLEFVVSETTHGSNLAIRYFYTNGDKENVGIEYINAYEETDNESATNTEESSKENKLDGAIVAFLVFSALLLIGFITFCVVLIIKKFKG